MNTAVLFLVFNRPDTTQEVFEAIRQAKPPRLYVAADGPRADRDGESARCEEVRKIALDVDWPCEVKTLFRAKNLGVMYACVNAINWFFDNEDEGIILEDDVIPALAFFGYCEYLLDYYRDNPKVMMISGCNPVAGRYHSDYTYDFTNYALVWGWASWKRAWKEYDVDMKIWPAFKRDRQLLEVPKATRELEIIWTDIYEKAYSKQIIGWDYQWFFAINRNHSFMVIPKVNLIKNIGFREDATHCHGGMPPEWVIEQNTDGALGEYRHPAIVENNGEIDRLFEKVVFGVNKLTYYKSIIKHIIGSENVNRITNIKTMIKAMQTEKKRKSNS